MLSQEFESPELESYTATCQQVHGKTYKMIFGQPQKVNH